jgi:hypothetical protein
MLGLRMHVTGERLHNHWLGLSVGHTSKPLIKSRNFDPESRSFKKHSRMKDDPMEDTVVKEVEGVAERIIAEDETRRAQELVGP